MEQMDTRCTELPERATALKESMIAWRREIHIHPELGFLQHDTARLVARVLREMGLHVQTGVGKTGVVARLGEGHPAIGLRADMDALAVQEANDVIYASQTPGVMHACGHDAHVAILLGVARLLAEMPDRPAGQVRFLFQPSEEGMDAEGKSGAQRMVEDGAVDGLDVIVAQHVTSDYPCGEVEIVDGYATAAVDTYEATILGAGCADAYPHTGLDTIFIAAQVINAIHGVRSTRVDPLRPSILSVSTVHGGSARNVIPPEVTISGTIRSYDDETRDLLPRELERALSVARALGGDYRLSLRKGYASTHNDARVAAVLRQVVLDLAGPGCLRKPQPGMSGEDFGCMMRGIPGVWFQLGAQIGHEKRPHHSPTFDIEESVLPLGAALLTETARRLLVAPVAGGQQGGELP